MIGFALFDGASDEAVAFVLAFAGGALLTMLIDTMVPEAFKLNGAVDRTAHDARLRDRLRDQRAGLSSTKMPPRC